MFIFVRHFLTLQRQGFPDKSSGTVPTHNRPSGGRSRRDGTGREPTSTGAMGWLRTDSFPSGNMSADPAGSTLSEQAAGGAER